MRSHAVPARLLVVVLTIVLVLLVAGCSKGEFVGSNLSTAYHEPTCVWAEQLESDREVWFSTAQEAEDAGYSPCSTCQPESPSDS